MKRVVFLNDLKESDIRPESIYNEYKDLLCKDIEEYFSNSSSLKKIDCPGCANQKTKFVFAKMGFDYHVCENCGSLFVSPRPTDEALRTFYKNSSAGLFLRKHFLKDTLESRSEKVFSYRIQWIIGLMEEFLPDAEVFLEYGTKYPTFLQELNSYGHFKSIVSVLPECYEQENLLPQNVRIIKEDSVKDRTVDIYAAFEVVEKAYDPGKIFSNAFNSCNESGILIITSAVASGFEYQVLGENSPNVIPPDRINLLSLEALTSQIEKAGFQIIEVSTPGRLDVEMVKKTYDKNPDIPLDPFWKYLFRYRNENALHSLQEYLQQFQLSSHVRIAAIKR